jgi:Flp pilus assembly protein TadB
MKNRFLISFIVTLAVAFLGFYFKNIYVMISSVIIGILYYKYQYFSIKNKKKKIIALKRRMFPAFVKKMLILIRTNNIYNALIKMVEYTDDPIKKYLNELIEDIKEDKSMKPFNKFANQMEFIEAYQIMAMLYTFSEHAMNKKHLVSLEVMISQLYDSEIDEIIESKKRLLWLFPNVTIITMLVMVFSIAIYMFTSILSEVTLG